MKNKKFDRKHKLLDAALEEFSQRSFDEASVNRILKKADISKGVFYYHFKDKEALYLCLVEETSHVKREYITKELQEHEFIEADIFGRFRIQAQEGIQFAKQYPKYKQFAGMIAKERNIKIREHLKAYFSQSRQIEELVECAINKGELSDTYPKEFVAAVIGFLFAHYDEIFPDDRDAFENLDRFISMMKNGLGKK